jgi:long-chain alkane monooxygenase
MFLSAMSLETITQQIGSVRAMARERGRRDGDILFLQGMMFIVGSTDEEALASGANSRSIAVRKPKLPTSRASAVWISANSKPPHPWKTSSTRVRDPLRVLSMINAWPAGANPTVKHFLT